MDGKPFVVNGVAYNPVDVGENWQFTWEDRSDRYDVDYPLMADMGANAVRVYAPLLTTAMLDKAWAEGLFVIPTFEVDPVNLECAEGKSFMQDRFVEMVSQWKDYLCHRMVDPIYEPGVSPTNDLDILASMSMPGTNFGTGMMHLDPSSSRRGPFDDSVSKHEFTVSPFHREAALCGTCHDVSNPAFEDDGSGNFPPGALDQMATDFSAHNLAPVERTYSEWLYSAYNSSNGVYAPRFAGNKADGYVGICQDCHMRDVAGQGCNATNAPVRPDLPLHDMTGGSTWLPPIIAAMNPGVVNSNAVADGVERAMYMLSNAVDMVLLPDGFDMMVVLTNQCGHKLPTGYPEGRRMWLNVRFYDPDTNLVSESGSYDFATGVLSNDLQAKIYEVKPGIDTNLASALGLEPGPSFHFVLNNAVFKDNRIPPRGFTNANYAAFGGAPVEYSYADGQYWDTTLYGVPEVATWAEVRLYYQSTSKEFIEFLRDENVTDNAGTNMYNLWVANDRCPPVVMAYDTWFAPLTLSDVPDCSNVYLSSLVVESAGRYFCRKNGTVLFFMVSDRYITFSNFSGFPVIFRLCRKIRFFHPQDFFPAVSIKFNERFIHLEHFTRFDFDHCQCIRFHVK